MERNLVQKGMDYLRMDYLRKVGRQLLASDSNDEVIDVSLVTNDKQKDAKPLSEPLQSEIQNLHSEIK